MNLPLFTVNAFASASFTGNPAAICPLEKWLDDGLLQAIAAQNNLAETAFFVRSEPGHYQLRWFTPTVEVPLCGHATLASAFVLRTELGDTSERIAFESKSGPLFVQCSDNLYTLDFPSQEAKRVPTPDWFPAAFGANPVECHQAAYLLAIFRSQDVVAAIEPDFALLANEPAGRVIISAPGDEHDFVSRFFAPVDGIDEDPVTGSAHCTLAPYWAKRLGKSKLRARQISERGGDVMCQTVGERVHISGYAQLYSRATIYL